MEKDPAVAEWSVLIVDDEVDNLGVPEGILGFHGATVKTAVSASDGLKILEDWQPTFVLMDLAMPNMDGWAMHRKLRRDEKLKDLTVIALTAHAMLGDKQRVLDAGFDGYIPKPISLDTFIPQIKHWLASKSALQHAQEAMASVEEPQKPTPADSASPSAKPAPAESADETTTESAPSADESPQVDVSPAAVNSTASASAKDPGAAKAG